MLPKNRSRHGLDSSPVDAREEGPDVAPLEEAGITGLRGSLAVDQADGWSLSKQAQGPDYELRQGDAFATVMACGGGAPEPGKGVVVSAIDPGKGDLRTFVAAIKERYGPVYIDAAPTGAQSERVWQELLDQGLVEEVVLTSMVHLQRRTQGAEITPLIRRNEIDLQKPTDEHYEVAAAVLGMDKAKGRARYLALFDEPDSEQRLLLAAAALAVGLEAKLGMPDVASQNMAMRLVLDHVRWCLEPEQMPEAQPLYGVAGGRNIDVNPEDWVGGLCTVFASALRERFGLPLMALVEEAESDGHQTVVHAFGVWEGKAVDGRGIRDHFPSPEDYGVSKGQGIYYSGEPSVFKTIEVTPERLQELHIEDVGDTAAALWHIDHDDAFSVLRGERWRRLEASLLALREEQGNT